MLNIKNLRQDYSFKTLDIQQLNADPFLQFKQWIQEAQEAQLVNFNAMVLATTSTQGYPSCRNVLLKELDTKGLLFFTNYESRKGKELADHPFACVNFYWSELERQLIVEGKVEKVTKEESEAYFCLRPRRSQLGTWASHQDQILASREELEQAYHYFEKKYEEQSIPVPPYWGGYRLLPHRFEFWQGRADRLHDRFQYQLHEDKWEIDRLSP